eukprot:NODE_18149_length_907_cov_10.646154.p2 GENE.NODE_18149_length_907_cov_10.646154~~NODE_18149_length_907_cov_10.646154.p2  ORF type:complete len:182 (-),score=66.01 NODE_18149_length_907_cov_10.646154:361-834(-)
MATRFNHPAAFCYKLPPHVSLEEGAMLEPLCVALQAVRRARVGIGMRVLITGAGPIGLMVMLAARAAGATRITISDAVQGKLDAAKALGAHDTFIASTPELPNAARGAAGGAFDTCFECCGVAVALETCVRAAASGGVVCVVANYPEPAARADDDEQ